MSDLKYKLGILTVSDKGSRGERRDTSSEAIRDILLQTDFAVSAYDIVPDEIELIVNKLSSWADEDQVDVILTTGGTGLGPRDVTPEATLSVIDKLVPGLAEAMRAESMKITSRAMLSRAIAGARKNCLIINLPGSPKAARECLDIILPALPHAVDILRGHVTECAASG